jgi:HK97 family phage portal protein
MSLLTKFFRRDTEAKALAISRDGTWDGFTPYGATYGQAHGTDTASLQETLSTNELVFACLKALGDAASDPRLIVQELKSKRDGTGKREYVEQVGHPLRRLIAKPNPLMSEGDLMKAAIASWSMSNPHRLYLEKERDRYGLLVGLWPLNPAEMSPRYRETEKGRVLIGWRWQCGGQFEDYTLDELIVRTGPKWFMPSPAAAANGSVLSDQAQTDYVGAYFENGGMPSTVLKDNSRVLNNDQREAARQRWAATYSNRTGAQHSIVVLDKDQELQKVGSDLKNLDSETLRMVAESRVCMVYGVPPLLIFAYVGLMRSTYANMKEAREMFWDLTISPGLKEWREFWTRTLLPEFEEQADIDGERVRLAYDLTTVAAMQDDVDALEKRATDSYRAGIRKLNEARAILNLPPEPDGDRFYTQPAPQPLPAKEGDDAATGDTPA